MPFQYAQTDKNKIVFTPVSTGCTSAFAIVLGLLFFCIGCCLLYFVRDNTMPFGFFKYVFPFMGLVAIWAGVQLPKNQKKTIPDQIIFDNAKGRIEMHQKESEVKSAFIYYDEVEGFKVLKKTHTSNSSKGNRSHTTYTYLVLLVKKDSGTWELLIENTQNAADLQIEKLNSLIDFSLPSTKESMKVVFTNKFEITKNRGSIEINWQNSVGYQPIILGFVIAFFIAIFWVIFGSFGAQKLSKGTDTFSYFFIGMGILIGGVFVFILGANILKLIKNAATNYTIGITNTQLNYLEKSKTGKINFSKSFEKDTIHAISYTFESADTTKSIEIFTHEQFQKKKELTQQLSFDSIKENYAFHKNLLSIELQNLTPVETLYIENFIQNEVLGSL